MTRSLTIALTLASLVVGGGAWGEPRNVTVITMDSTTITAVHPAVCESGDIKQCYPHKRLHADRRKDAPWTMTEMPGIMIAPLVEPHCGEALYGSVCPPATQPPERGR